MGDQQALSSEHNSGPGFLFRTLHGRISPFKRVVYLVSWVKAGSPRAWGIFMPLSSSNLALLRVHLSDFAGSFSQRMPSRILPMQSLATSTSQIHYPPPSWLCSLSPCPHQPTAQSRGSLPSAELLLCKLLCWPPLSPSLSRSSPCCSPCSSSHTFLPSPRHQFSGVQPSCSNLPSPQLPGV